MPAELRKLALLLDELPVVEATVAEALPTTPVVAANLQAREAGEYWMGEPEFVGRIPVRTPLFVGPVDPPEDSSGEVQPEAQVVTLSAPARVYMSMRMPADVEQFVVGQVVTVGDDGFLVAASNAERGRTPIGVIVGFPDREEAEVAVVGIVSTAGTTRPGQELWLGEAGFAVTSPPEDLSARRVRIGIALDNERALIRIED